MKRLLRCLTSGALFLASLFATAETITYDSLNRVTQIQYDSGDHIAYTYDSAGNILTKTTVVAIPQFSLLVTSSGAGAGTVTSTPVGIDCGATCLANFDSGTAITLTATAGAGSTFGGWTDCPVPSGNQCAVTMNAPAAVTATFSLATIAGTDFNADGKSDLLWVNADGRVAVWLMNGVAATATSEILPAGTGFGVAHMADFDGDGKADLLWQHPDGRAAVWLMNGTAPTATAQILNAGIAAGRRWPPRTSTVTARPTSCGATRTAPSPPGS